MGQILKGGVPPPVSSVRVFSVLGSHGLGLCEPPIVLAQHAIAIGGEVGPLLNCRPYRGLEGATETSEQDGKHGGAGPTGARAHQVRFVTKGGGNRFDGSFCQLRHFLGGVPTQYPQDLLFTGT